MCLLWQGFFFVFLAFAFWSLASSSAVPSDLIFLWQAGIGRIWSSSSSSSSACPVVDFVFGFLVRLSRSAFSFGFLLRLHRCLRLRLHLRLVSSFNGASRSPSSGFVSIMFAIKIALMLSSSSSLGNPTPRCPSARPRASGAPQRPPRPTARPSQRRCPWSGPGCGARRSDALPSPQLGGTTPHRPCAYPPKCALCSCNPEIRPPARPLVITFTNSDLNSGFPVCVRGPFLLGFEPKPEFHGFIGHTPAPRPTRVSCSWGFD